MFASDLDAASRQQLDRGQSLMELLKQPQYTPFPVEEQVVSIWLGTTGKLDDVPVGDIRRFESEYLSHLRRGGTLLAGIKETGKFEDSTGEALEKDVSDFKQGFLGQGIDGKAAPGHEESKALEEGELDQEQIVIQKRG